MYWEKDIETIPREKLEELQLARLKEGVKKASASVFYGDLFKKTGIDPNEIRSLEDIKKIPFTTKDDLREHWPYGFLAV
ncbi:MAG: phenylacetate--CoA ligase, partial [Thermodesulfobacteriota bacterium]|nr:phenylacetate--CoA ligase [Thermodesulfobacteriota bacterium]